MDTAGKTILVTGATGQQGGAALRHLREHGFGVRALTRDAQADKARALSGQGIEVVQGDIDDRASLDRALEGAYGAFSVQNFALTGVEGEVRQGQTLADAAKAAGLRHVVYSSVGSAHRQTGIPHFDSKFQIEEYIRSIDLPHTILRPVYFMENWFGSRDYILGGTLGQPLDPAKPLQQVAVDDIGAFAALAFADPDRWLGQAVDLAGDELTGPQSAEVFGRVIGRPVRYVQTSLDQIRQYMGDEGVTMFEWFDEVGYEADIPALRALYPRLTTLEQWLRKTGWENAGAQRA